MGLLIINADDFGYSPGVNSGIIEAYTKGVVTSTTMMANMPGFEDGVRLALEHPNLGIGVHLVLTCGKPLCLDCQSLMDENTGEFWSLSHYEQDFMIDEKELFSEWNKQIEVILATGIKPTHMDSHHHVNALPKLRETFERLARIYGFPIRNNYDVAKDLRTTENFYGVDSLAVEKPIWKDITVRQIVRDAKHYRSLELMCHPAYVDEILMKGSSFNIGREATLKEITLPYYHELLDVEGIQLGSFADL